MRNLTGIALALAATVLLGSSPAHAQDEDIAVENGGIHVDGWMGVIDARAAEGGATIEDALLAANGDVLHVRTGPATT